MFKNKNICLIISVILAIIWMFISIFAMGNVSTGLNSEDIGTSIGTAIGMILFMPYLVISSIGAILHTIGGFTYIKGMILAGLICECVGLLLGFAWGFGYIPVIILGFIGYSRTKKNI